MIAEAALLSAVVALLCSPYLAGLTLTVPDRDDPRWWAWSSMRRRQPSRRRHLVTAVLGGALAALAGAAAGMSLLLPGFIFIALVLSPLVIIDFETRRLPDRLVFLGQFGGLCWLLLVAACTGSWADLLRSLEAGAGLFLLFCLIVLAAPRSFGFGDVKLLGLLGGMLGWFGWLSVYYGVFAGFVLGSVVGIGQLAAGRGTLKSQIPFGPSLIIGALLVAALHRTF